MRKLGLLGCFVFFLMVITLPVAAGATDGLTPAEETICDPLKKEGVTKGLYGLCVAFCEAQDLASETIAITPEELEALEVDAPSGRILANYNKKKQESDPEMPCIVVEPPCPCFTQEELQSIDGWNEVGGYSLKLEKKAYPYGGVIRELSRKEDMQAAHMNAKPGKSYVCSYVNNQSKIPVSRSFRTDEKTLTMQEWETCKAMFDNELSDKADPMPIPVPNPEPVPIIEK